MVDIELLQRAYKNMSDQELIKIEIEDKNNISQEALAILQSEIVKRGINIEKINSVLAKSDIEFYKLFISSQNFALPNGNIYLINELNKRLKKYSKKFNNEEFTYLVSRIKEHKTAIKNMPEEEYLALISYLKISRKSEKDEQALHKILKSSADELLKSDIKISTEKSGIIFNLHEAGRDIKNIGKYLTRYFVGQLLFIFGYLLQFQASGKQPSSLFLLLNGIAVIVIIIMIIQGFYNAGNALLRIKDEVTNSDIVEESKPKLEQ
jgi:hypothetical protein